MKKERFRKTYLLYGWNSYVDRIPIFLHCLLSGCKDTARAMVLVPCFNGVVSCFKTPFREEYSSLKGVFSLVLARPFTNGLTKVKVKIVGNFTLIKYG